MNIETQAYEVLERVVKARGTSGGVYLPVSWTGKRVKVLLLDPIEEESLSEHEAGDVVSGRVCPECGSRLVWRRWKTGKGELYVGCTNYDGGCRYQERMGCISQTAVHSDEKR
jgi:putative transposon-encoded protein